MKVVLLPGMGCKDVASSNWYSWFAEEMHKRSWDCKLRDFPDPDACRESIWIPFVRNEIGLDEETVLVGHSSGAACAMRLLERGDPKLLGVILVAAAHTDLDDPAEAKSEYFNRPWNWDAMKDGAQNIVLFHSADDDLIPVDEARHIAGKLAAEHFEYHEMITMSHFFEPWQELLDIMDEKFGSSSK